MPVFPGLQYSYDFSDPACYSGSGNTVFDLTANNLDLPIVNATFAGSGQSKYFQFDGNADYIGKTSVSGLGDTFTTNIWYQLDVVNSTGRQLWNSGVNSASGTNPGFYLNYPSTSDLIYGFSFGVGTTTATGVLSANTWQMATVTADGTTTKLYIDGVLAGSVAQGIGTWATGGFAIGAGVDGSGNISAGADGLLGKVATLDVYNVALGSTQIASIYSESLGRFNGLTISYDFSDPACYPGTGSTIFDLSGNAIDSTNNNATYVGAGNSSYFSFNGIDSIIVSESYNQNKTVFTYNIWAQFTSTDLGYIVITGAGNLGPSGGGSPVLAVNELAPNGEYRFNFGNGIAEMTAPGIGNTWRMLTITADGTTCRFYINGSLVDTSVQGNGAIDSGAQQTRLGGYGVGFPPGAQSGYWDGYIGTFEYYQSALSQAEITAIYNATSSRFLPPTPPTPATLIGSYDFSDPACYPGSGSTTVIYDLSGEGNNLSVTSVSFGGTGQSIVASFNGDTSYLYDSQFSASGATFGGNEFTISLWHRYYNNQQDDAYLVMGGNGAAGQGPGIVIDGADGNKVKGVFGIEITAGGWVEGDTNTSNQWHMSTLVADGTNFLLYQDGALTGSTSLNGQWGGRGFILGRGLGSSFQPSPVGPGYRFAGEIAIAEVYDGALGSTAISNLYATQQPRFYPNPPPAQNLIASYDFSNPACYNGTGNTAFDVSGQSNNLILTNSPLLTGTGTSKTLELRRSSNQTARKLTPLNGIPDIPMTFNIWAKLNPATNADALMSYGIIGNATIPGIWSKFFNQFISFEGGFSNPVISSGITANNTDFYNIMASIGISTVTLYVNGAAVGTSNHNIVLPPNSQFSLSGLIGDGGAYLTNADIAIAEVYSVDLDSSEVTSLYNTQLNRFAPQPAYEGRVGGRQFNQGFNG